MSTAGHTTGPGGVVHNAIHRYYAEIQAAARIVATERAEQPAIPLAPAEPAEFFAAFTDVTDIALTQVQPGISILDLMRNPGTGTTKSMASLLMVARAVSHIRRTGERVLLLTPTSGNKGTALRDAVARAYSTGLASPERLRIVMVAPAASRDKLRGCPLTADTALRRANPVAVANVDQPADVKPLSSQVFELHAARIHARTGFRLWYTLDLDNYRVADAARAFAEAELLPITDGSPPRLHVHAVSSAFGLLGYHLGHRLLSAGLPGWTAPAWHPGFFLVQQLATPDMVTSLLGVKPPDYERDEAGSVWRQRSTPEFPGETDDPHEVIDPTFYTKSPTTREQINDIVGRHGGGGVVVSRRECLDRYGQVRDLAARAGLTISADPARIREWSLVKALTGVLVARERGLLDAGTDIVVHASGYFNDELIPPMPDEHITRIDTVEELARLVFQAAGA